MTRTFLIALIVVLVCGCKSEDSSTVDKGATEPNVSANGRAIASQPPTTVPAGGIMMQPSDPNDPKFKPDPKLSGGG